MKSGWPSIGGNTPLPWIEGSLRPSMLPQWMKWADTCCHWIVTPSTAGSWGGTAYRLLGTSSLPRSSPWTGPSCQSLSLLHITLLLHSYNTIISISESETFVDWSPGEKIQILSVSHPLGVAWELGKYLLWGWLCCCLWNRWTQRQWKK